MSDSHLHPLHEYEQLKRQNRHRLLGASVVAISAGIFMIYVLNQNSGGSTPHTVTVTVDNTNYVLQTKPSDSIPPPAASADKYIQPDNKTLSAALEPTTPTATVQPTHPSATALPHIKQGTNRVNTQSKADDLAEIIQQQNNRPRLPAAQNKAVQTVIQVGAYRHPNQAKKMQQKLADIGFSTYIRETDTNNGKMHRLLTASYPNRPAANQALETLRQKGINGIITENP